MIKSNEIFFDQVSEFYDSMIDFTSAIENRKLALAKFVKSGYKNALDLGCGTGVDSIALASLGLNVFSIDQSEKMIEKAKLNSLHYLDKILFKKENLTDTNLLKNHFDIVISLGNTFANVNAKDLLKVFKNIYCSLRQNGSFLIQILNYTAILKSNQRLINTTEDADNIFVRFYDFGLENINFNILKLSKKNIKDTQLITTKLYSHQSELLKEYLLKAGFNKIYFYADFKMNKYYKLKSKDLVVLSIK